MGLEPFALTGALRGHRTPVPVRSLPRALVVAALLLSLLCYAAAPVDIELGASKIAARWVGLRVWYTTRASLDSAAQAVVAPLFQARPAGHETTFPTSIIQPRV